MGQQVSTDEKKNEGQVPYTKYSLPKDGESSVEEPIKQGGITVVNPNPEAGLRVNVPIELQKLGKIHRFWPILKSSLESIPPQEKITDGVDYKHVLRMCQRYQEHLGEAAKIVSHEQRALSSRLRDIEMFSAGVTQQIIGRDEKMERISQHLQRVDEVSQIMNNISTSLAHCIPLLQFLNNQLPDDLRLETFRLREVAPVQPVEDMVDSTTSELSHRPIGQVVTREEEVELEEEPDEEEDTEGTEGQVKVEEVEVKGDDNDVKLEDSSRTGRKLLGPEDAVEGDDAVAGLKRLGLEEKVEEGADQDKGGADQDGKAATGEGVTEMVT